MSAMSQSAVVCARIDQSTKEVTGKVLDALGITPVHPAACDRNVAPPKSCRLICFPGRSGCLMLVVSLRADAAGKKSASPKSPQTRAGADGVSLPVRASFSGAWRGAMSRRSGSRPRSSRPRRSRLRRHRQTTTGSSDRRGSRLTGH